MKLTRIFLLKSYEKDYKDFDNTDPAKSLMKLIITNQNIDNLILFFLSFIYTISIGFINSSFYDKIFIKLYLYLIKKLNNYLSKNKLYIIDNQNELSLYLIIIKYPHTLGSFIHLVKFLLFAFTFGLSFTFWILYIPYKLQLGQYSFNVINIFIGEFLSLYCLFRLCYFFIKFIVSFLFSPAYFSCLYLGYYEDKINEKLNELINTRIYTDESCLVSRDSMNKFQKDETITSCSICLENYVKGDVISTLPCSKRHTFHSYCLEEWFLSNILCPLCRYDFTKEFGMLFPDNNNQEENDDENNFLQNIINNLNNNDNNNIANNEENNLNNNYNNDNIQQENNINNINPNNILYWNNNAENNVKNIEMNELNINNNEINNNNQVNNNNH